MNAFFTYTQTFRLVSYSSLFLIFLPFICLYSINISSFITLLIDSLFLSLARYNFHIYLTGQLDRSTKESTQWFHYSEGIWRWRLHCLPQSCPCRWRRFFCDSPVQCLRAPSRHLHRPLVQIWVCGDCGFPCYGICCCYFQIESNGLKNAFLIFIS